MCYKREREREKERLNLPYSNRFGLKNLTNFLKAERRDVGNRVNFLPTRRRFHLHEDRVGIENEENDICEL
jgi:hypothetical protein